MFSEVDLRPDILRTFVTEWQNGGRKKQKTSCFPRKDFRLIMALLMELGLFTLGLWHFVK